MATTFHKIIRVIKAPNTGHRILLAINKSPLRHLLKFIALILYRQAYLKRKLQFENHKITAIESIALNKLQEFGYVEVAELFSKESLETLLNYSNEKLAKAENIRNNQKTSNKGFSKKDFWIRLSDEDIGDKMLSCSNPMVKIALEPQILSIAGAYLQQTAFLDYILLTLSSFGGDTLKSSQLWHFDRDDTRMLKLFVYLTDVKSESDGPFTFIDKIQSNLIKNSFIMRHLEDSEVNRYVKKSDYIQMIRPKLSCFLVDTSVCYHMGSRLPPDHSRVMLTALFLAPPSNYFSKRKEFVSLDTNETLTNLQVAAIRN